MKNQNIYIVSPTESHLTQRGKRHPDLAELLTKHQYNVKYITSNFNHALKTEISRDEIKYSSTRYKSVFIENGIYKKNLSIDRILWNLKFSLKAYRYLKNLKLTSNDVIIIPSRPSELIYFISKLKVKYKCRLILDIRDIWPDSLKSSGLKKYIFSAYCNFFQKKSIKSFDAYLHVAPSFTNWLKRYNENANSKFLPLGIDERFKDFSKELNESSAINYIYGGTLTYQFDISNAVEAIDSLKYRFLIFGDNGSGERYKEIKEMVRRNDKIKLLNFVDPNKVPDLYKEADVSIIYMKAGALPNKVFDALGSYTPILSIGEGDVSNFVKKYNIGWYVANDPTEIKLLIKDITREEVNQKIKNIENIRVNYLRDNLLDDYVRLIKNLCNN